MSKRKVLNDRLEELFIAAESVRPDPVQAEDREAVDDSQTYTYVDSASAMDHDLLRIVELGRTLTRLRDLETLLPQAAAMIWKQFDIHNAQIYLLESSQRSMSLRAVAGEASQEILQKGARLPVDPHSVAGVALTTRQPVVIHNVQSSELFAPEPLLPEACCRLALPLLTHQQAFGVLDLHISNVETFSPGRQAVLEILANRLAAAIEAVVLADRSQQDLDDDSGDLHSQTRLGWDDFLDAITVKEHMGFQYDFEQDEVIADSLALPTVGQISDDTTLAVPLKLSDETVGAIRLERAFADEGLASYSWSQEEARLVKAVAERVAQHLDNLRLLTQAERYRVEAEEAARRLTREGWEDYIQAIADAPSGYMYDLDQVKPLDDDGDLKVWSQSEQHNLSKQELRVRDETIGEFSLADIDADDAIAAGILATVSERLSTHIENLRLLEETEKSRQQLDKRAAELETVARVSTAAATILSPQELLQSVVDLTKYSFNLYHVQVYMLGEDKESLVLKAGAGRVGHRMVEETDKLSLATGKSVVVRAALSRQGVMVNDARQDPDFHAHVLLPDALGELAVPMVVGDQLLGVFDVLASITDRFSNEDMRTFTTLASQVSVALRNAELYAEQMAAVVRLRELDHLKSSFLANMSHELRTPLNSILGFTQVIMEGLDGPLTDDMENDLALIEKNGNHLLHLINEILDMAKIEAGRMSLSPEPVSLKELLNDVIDTSASLIRDRSIYMAFQNEEQANITLLLDYTRMRQVFLNVIGNAAKFTEEGGITVSVERYGSKLHVLIRDTGIGIPPDKLETIFESFSQVDTSTTRKVGGTGLGLPISRRLVEMHGGRLWAESSGVPGEGSAFIIELPANPVEKV